MSAMVGVDAPRFHGPVYREPSHYMGVAGDYLRLGFDRAVNASSDRAKALEPDESIK